MPRKQRPCPLTPEELRAVYATDSVATIARTYQTGNQVVLRWLRDAGIEAASMGRGNTAGRVPSRHMCACGQHIYRSYDTGEYPETCSRCRMAAYHRQWRARKKISVAGK